MWTGIEHNMLSTVSLRELKIINLLLLLPWNRSDNNLHMNSQVRIILPYNTVVTLDATTVLSTLQLK